MMPRLDTIGRLRWALSFLLLSVAASIGIVLAALHHARQADAENRQAIAERDEIRTRLGRAQDEAEEIRLKISRYRELVERNYIGQEHRLEWVERIAQIKAARQLIGVRYELGPQKPVDPRVLPGVQPMGGYEFMASTMNLQMQLLHEEDLLNFLADLQSGIHAFLHVRNCSIERIRRGGADRGPVAQLHASCVIDWVTLREKP